MISFLLTRSLYRASMAKTPVLIVAISVMLVYGIVAAVYLSLPCFQHSWHRESMDVEG